ncbi:uncharacterized protein LOC101855683 [Aplysia californica]|uniref:Uncharacterized protein LOC101855683 n=1 Tax=Aplysia californica TaxID=6500 RepID=A0ABM0J9Z9_APLCA|nr:uncharacterized protein LOC101855683 [Aplysia californica]
MDLGYDKRGSVRFLWGICLVLSWTAVSLEASCISGVHELWAYSNPSTETFKDKYKEYVTSDKGEICRWIITASDKDEVVKISFPSYKLKVTNDGDKVPDCVMIYDGPSREADILAEICDGAPDEYESSGREMFVVYQRGDVEGTRSFTLKYSSKEVLTKEKIIRIAGGVGGVLAAVGLTYVVFRATRCCACLRSKRGGSEPNLSESHQESTRLTVVGVPSPETETDVAASNNNNNNSNNGRSGAAAVRTENNGAGASGSGQGSDSDSLHEMNEPPPSYESLYLTEQGITPPEYTPPQHQERHPPRRVHTFN